MEMLNTVSWHLRTTGTTWVLSESFFPSTFSVKDGKIIAERWH